MRTYTLPAEQYDRLRKIVEWYRDTPSGLNLGDRAHEAISDLIDEVAQVEEWDLQCGNVTEEDRESLELGPNDPVDKYGIFRIEDGDLIAEISWDNDTEEDVLVVREVGS